MIRTTGGKAQNEDFFYEREARERKVKERSVHLARRRSHSDQRSKYRYEHDHGHYDEDVAREADYYHRKTAERTYVGEAYNGATKDWAIVDVPPGTNRVNMNGVGGANQEVTWQRYNGVRRSKFVTADGVEYDSGFGINEGGGGELERSERRISAQVSKPRTREKEMWTEITKDLVLKEAIEMFGCEYEETDYFYYVMDYLRYVRFYFPTGPAHLPLFLSFLRRKYIPAGGVLLKVWIIVSVLPLPLLIIVLNFSFSARQMLITLTGRRLSSRRALGRHPTQSAGANTRDSVGARGT